MLNAADCLPCLFLRAVMSLCKFVGLLILIKLMLLLLKKKLKYLIAGPAVTGIEGTLLWNKINNYMLKNNNVYELTFFAKTWSSPFFKKSEVIIWMGVSKLWSIMNILYNIKTDNAENTRGSVGKEIATYFKVEDSLSELWRRQNKQDKLQGKWGGLLGEGVGVEGAWRVMSFTGKNQGDQVVGVIQEFCKQLHTNAQGVAPCELVFSNLLPVSITIFCGEKPGRSDL